MKLYVGNISFDTNENSLRDAFSPYGEVEEVAVITDRETGQSRGFAFVTMRDDAAGNAAMAAINGKELNGRTLNVNEARAKTAGGGGGGGGGGGRGGQRRGSW